MAGSGVGGVKLDNSCLTDSDVENLRIDEGFYVLRLVRMRVARPPAQSGTISELSTAHLPRFLCLLDARGLLETLIMTISLGITQARVMISILCSLASATAPMSLLKSSTRHHTARDLPLIRCIKVFAIVAHGHLSDRDL
jgi:hypothetical protein